MTTPNLGLSSTSQSSGSLVKFLDWRLLQDGDALTSNMQKIDAWAGLVSASLVGILDEKIHAIYSTGNGATYSANEPDITSYSTALTINLAVDVANTGVTTLNINMLGDKFLKKMVAGVRTDLQAGDLLTGSFNTFIYDTGEFVWVGYQANALHSTTLGEINGITAKTTPVDADITLIEDSQASFAKKKLTWANIKATLKSYFDTLYATSSDAIRKSVAGQFATLIQKGTANGNDTVLIEDYESVPPRQKKYIDMSTIYSYCADLLSGIFAPIAKGVTNGDSHDHSGGDGAQINHATLSNIGTNAHIQIDSHIASGSSFHGTTGLSNVEPGIVSSSTSGSSGTSDSIARADHSHDLGEHAHTGATDGGQLAHSSLSGSGINTHSQIDTNLANILSGSGYISHSSLSGIGTNTHATLDTFVASKASANGLASLNASSLVVQNPANSTATPTASKIPIADTTGKLDGWITGSGVTNGNSHDHSGGDGAQINHTTLSNIGTNTHATLDTFVASKASANGLASLNASSLVVQNPANSTATPTASKIPIADTTGKLDDWVTAWTHLATPLTSTSWDGDAKSLASGIIDLSVVFGVPAGVKAVQVRFEISATVSGIFGGLGRTNSTSLQVGQTTQVANVRINASGTVNCDANGDIYFYQNGDLSYVKIEIHGYLI